MSFKKNLIYIFMLFLANIFIVDINSAAKMAPMPPEKKIFEVGGYRDLVAEFQKLKNDPSKVNEAKNALNDILNYLKASSDFTNSTPLRNYFVFNPSSPHNLYTASKLTDSGTAIQTITDRVKAVSDGLDKPKGPTPPPSTVDKSKILAEIALLKASHSAWDANLRQLEDFANKSISDEQVKTIEQILQDLKLPKSSGAVGKMGLVTKISNLIAQGPRGKVGPGKKVDIKIDIPIIGPGKTTGPKPGPTTGTKTTVTPPKPGPTTPTTTTPVQKEEPPAMKKAAFAKLPDLKGRIATIKTQFATLPPAIQAIFTKMEQIFIEESKKADTTISAAKINTIDDLVDSFEDYTKEGGIGFAKQLAQKKLEASIKKLG